MKCNQCLINDVESRLTGTLCTKCYFENKRKLTQPIQQIELNPRSESVTEISKSELNSTEITNPEYEIKKEHHPKVEQNQPVPGVKYCQSCIERGYGLTKATREFRKGEFICDDCFRPLLDNTLGYAVDRAEINRIIPEVDNDKPILEQFYNLLDWPSELRYTKSEHVLQNRNQIFNHRALSLTNVDLPDIVNKIEELQVMLFQIKISLEPLTDYINRVKADERSKANLESLKKSQDEIKKPTSKIKLDKDQKMADAMFKMVERDPSKRLKMYQEMTAKARLTDFNKLTGN